MPGLGAAPEPHQLLGQAGEHRGARGAVGCKFLPKGGVQALSSGITIPRRVHKTRGCGSWGWGLVVNVELMILEGFSSPDHSVFP